ncbi:MAG TPA: hypothetical protein VLE96_05225 [Chlamydiales bacterium]|nr:hypothetical protein [Chlamydiales bacterium]
MINCAAFNIAKNTQPIPQEPIVTRPIFLSTPATQVPWAHNFQSVHDHRDLLNNSLNADFEYLVKVQVPDGLQKGQKITLQTNDGPVEYIVYRKIAIDGLVSYAFKPFTENHPPLIVFRCTEPNFRKEHSFHSMQNDTDPHLGERGWLAARKTFEKLMKDRKFRGKGQKIKVAGYSLGGAHAQYFVAEHHARVSHAIFYNDPSIRADVVEDFAKNVHEPIVIQIFRNSGDPFTHFGSKHLGCGVTHSNAQVQLLEIHTPQQDRFNIDQHSKRIFKTDDYNYTVEEFTDPNVLAIKLDHTKRDPITIIAEKIRLFYGNLLSKMLGSASRFKTSCITFIEEEARLPKKKKAPTLKN